MCGEENAAEHVHDDGCERCGGSPLCDHCGHPRRLHTGVFGSGTRGCRSQERDVQSLSVIRCAGAGYSPRTSSFAEAGFATANDALPPLRIAAGDDELAAPGRCPRGDG